MSYDYNALVEEISQHRQQLSEAASEEERLTHLQGAMDGFARLSSHCPMTPRLWIQYAHDAAQFVMETTTATETATDTTTTANNHAVSNEEAAEAVEAATSTRLDILELGLNEFPGCAMIHVHYLELLADAAATTATASQEYHDKFVLALRRAVTMVGSGSHRNEDMCWIVNLYRLGAYYSVQQQPSQSHDPKIITWPDVFLQRSQTPMQHGNEALISEFVEFAKSHPSQQQQQPNVATLQATMEEHRRSIRFLDSFLARYEDEVDVALQAEGVLARPDHFAITSFPTRRSGNENESFWKDLLQPTSASASTLQAKPYANGWMGLGGDQTAKAFIKYAQALANYHWTKEKLAVTSESMNHAKIHQLILSVYERSIAECPTVESLWLAYLGYLTRRKRKDPKPSPKKKQKDESAMVIEDEDKYAALIIDWDKCQSVAHRAVRNCPYSISLLQQRMKMALLMSNANVTVLDPDTLMTMVQEALASGFFTTASSENARLELYLTAVRLVQRRILFLLTTTKTAANGTLKSYDEAAFPATPTESQKLSPPPPPLDVKLQQEIEDLCDDLRDMYETADESLRSFKEQPTSQMARFILWKDRCRCERDLLTPYQQSLQLESDTTTTTKATQQSSFAAILACHDQWVRMQQPAHPDSYSAYIDAVRSCSPLTHPSDIITKLQWIRALYQKGLSSAASANANASSASTQASLSSSSSSLWSLLGRDYEVALREFCQSYLEFEHLFGSDESYETARQAIDKKRGAMWSVAAAAAAAANQETQPFQDTQVKGRKSKPSPGKATVATASGSTVAGATKTSPETEVNVAKRSRPANEQIDEDTQMPPDKKPRSQVDDTDNHNEEDEPLTVATVAKPEGGPLESAMDGMQLETPTTEKDEASKAKRKQQQHKVRIGKLEYPAHPFTVRVSNLTPDTQDMDLVDVFRPKCGPIVHAKIIRDRHPPHASKGWGLVQFEDREAVDKALALHDVIGIHERLAQVQRSHMPAATLVPPGKHRVNPQGQGKVSKRNQKRREGKDPKQANNDDDDDVSMGQEPKQQQSQSTQSQKRAAKDSSNSSESKSMTAKATPAATAATTTKGSTSTVFSFRPRNVVVGHKTDHRKVKLDLDKKEEK